MKARNRTVALFAALLVSGCANGILSDKAPTLEQIKFQSDFRATEAAQSNADEQRRCQSYGAKPGTDTFVQCMVSLAQTDAQMAIIKEQQRKDDKRRKIDAVAKAMAPKTNCTTTPIGNTANTTCY